MPEGYPSQDVLRQNGWLPTPRATLPFPSIVAASTNDPLGRLDRVAALAAAWGSRLVNVGAVGHLNPAAGFGEWPQAEDLIRELHRVGAPTVSASWGSAALAVARLARRLPPPVAGRCCSAPSSPRLDVHRRDIAAGRRCSTRCCSAWRSTVSPSTARPSPASISPRAGSCASASRCSVRGSRSSRSRTWAGRMACW